MESKCCATAGGADFNKCTKRSGNKLDCKTTSLVVNPDFLLTIMRSSDSADVFLLLVLSGCVGNWALA